ncbi:50S ribosomal protein L25/general stress protein Ctc [Sedimenticola selenatireducens]|uniref:Large ribosomal subunit protein bL25 n=1 Tax=Sedimenticola selenatireducens TaxID=191960 RepID=A0A2N6CTF5_9GAMM|nr:50S ribosomal protein L25/general stress protein Ctc [Sedimenticola selenatireducens]PLX60451.1 MAG: 50S ribosomal protein L25 [Sedimenticola selenatireducens]
MKEVFVVNAQLRTDTGKGASRRLRHAGLVLGIVYGAHQDPAMISMVHSDLIQRLDQEAFYSHILTLKIDGKSEQVILKDLQRHPARPFIMHADFLRVSAKEKLKTHVPLHFVGEDVAPGVKAGGVVSHLLTEVEVSCLPGDLPEYIEVNVAGLEVGDAAMLSEVALPKGVELPALAQDEPQDVQVVSIHTAHVAVEEDEIEEEGEGAAEE